MSAEGSRCEGGGEESGRGREKSEKLVVLYNSCWKSSKPTGEAGVDGAITTN